MLHAGLGRAPDIAPDPATTIAEAEKCLAKWSSMLPGARLWAMPPYLVITVDVDGTEWAILPARPFADTVMYCGQSLRGRLHYYVQIDPAKRIWLPGHFIIDLDPGAHMAETTVARCRYPRRAGCAFSFSAEYHPALRIYTVMARSRPIGMDVVRAMWQSTDVRDHVALNAAIYISQGPKKKLRMDIRKSLRTSADAILRPGSPPAG